MKAVTRVCVLAMVAYTFIERTSQRIMKHTLTSKGLTWINVQSPEPEELAEFVRLVRPLPGDAEFLAQDHRRPEVAVRPDYLLLLIRVPVFDRRARVTRGAALFFVIKEHELFSLHYEPIVALDRIRRSFEESPERQEEYFEDEAMSLCLYIVSLLYDSAFQKLERLAKHIDIAEEAVFQGNERKMVEEISVLTRDVMDFRKVIRPQKSLFGVAFSHPLVTLDAAARWRRVHGQLLRMWEILEGMFESVRELANTNFTLLQHKENELLRLLTIYSIIAIPAFILVAPFNLPAVPFSSPIFYGLLWLVAIFTLILIVIFVRTRRWR
jgi:magnesium transporter